MMDGFSVPKPSNAEAHRDEFNSAYATLEQTIRNFSKEKLLYEQTIGGLHDQLAVAQESIQKLSVDNQDIIAENKRLMLLHEEHEKTRDELDTLLSTAESRQQIISETVHGYEKVERDFANRYEEQEDFIYCLKFRQVQLKKWIDDCINKIDTLHEIMEDQTKQLHETRRSFDEERRVMQMNFEERRAQYEVEKEMLIKNHVIAVKELNLAIVNIQNELAETKINMTKDVNNLQEEKMALLQQLEKINTRMEEQANTFEEEKKAAKAAFEEELSKIRTEKDTLEINHKIAVDELLRSIENIQKELSDAQIKMTDEISRLQGERTVLEEKLNEMKATMDRQITSFDNEKKTMNAAFAEESTKFKAEKETLEANHKLAVDELLRSIENIQKELSDTQFKMADEISNLQGERTTLLEKLEKIQATMEKKVASFDNEKKAMSDALAEELAKFKLEKETLEANHKTAVDELQRSIENIQKELSDTKTEMLGNVASLEGEKTALSDQLEQMKISVEKQATQFEDEKKAMNAATDEERAKVKAERETLEANNKAAIDDLNLTIENVRKELSSLETKSADEVAALRGEKTSLLEKLEELRASMEKLVSDFNDEKTAMKETFEEEYAGFEAEKEKLMKAHKAEIDDLKEELEHIKTEKRDLQKRYHDQKHAIAKMVEEVGVRPVILPQGKASHKERIPVTPTSSQDKLRADALRQTPKTPAMARSFVLPDPTTPTRIGILKRHSFSAGDKSNKNVTFGPTFKASFEITSDTDESTTETSDFVSKKEASSKRLKLSEEAKAATDHDDKEDEANDKDRTKFEKPSRRYLKRGISQHKKSSLDIQSALRFEKS